jgi:DNA-binding CsgD family transcriptional regulator
MNCNAATFPTRAEAARHRRALIRTRGVFVAVVHCEECDAFHFSNEEAQRYPFNSRRSLDVLRCLAQGFRDAETSEIVGYTPRTVEDVIARWSKRLGAQSRPHLVAIAIALGFLNPNDFVPAERERLHA